MIKVHRKLTKEQITGNYNLLNKKENQIKTIKKQSKKLIEPYINYGFVGSRSGTKRKQI